MTTLLEDAQAQADALNNAQDHFAAYTDPAEAAADRPCWLIGPPVLDGGTLGGAVGIRRRIVALSGYDAGNAAALDELQALIAIADRVLGIDRADPTYYQLTDGPRIAAYQLTTGDDWLDLTAPDLFPDTFDPRF